MASFRENIDNIRDGEDVSASTANRPLSQLLQNDIYLRDLLSTLSNGEALFRRNVPLDSALLVGHVVYWDDADGRYEKALADESIKQNVEGFVYSKTSATLGDLVILGSVDLDLTNALEGEALTAGQYYLSTTVAGTIVAPSPGLNVRVGVSDGNGRVFVYSQIADLRGFQGYQGFQGVQGAQGFQGNQGFQGHQGNQGNQGFQGRQGFQGVVGSQGSQGFQGVQGSQGFQGSVGVQGSQGAQGFQGNQGNTGVQGFQGDVGAQGFQGDIGAQGNQGDIGSQGFQGDVGAQGFQGDIGAQGFQGDVGAQGFQGDVGAQGFQGVGVQGVSSFLHIYDDNIINDAGDAYATVVTYGDVAQSTARLGGTLLIGSQDMTNEIEYRFTVEDVFGNQGVSSDFTFGAPGRQTWNIDEVIPGASAWPPFKQLMLEIRNASAGNQSGYVVYPHIIFTQ